MELLAYFLMAFVVLQPQAGSGGSGASFAPAVRIDEASLNGLINNPIIQSFDVSPDGSSVVLLVASGLRMEAPLWLVTEDVAARRVTSSRELGHLTILNANFAPQVRFAHLHPYLIVQDLRTIQVFDSKTLEPIRTISPPSGEKALIPLFITGASKRDIFVCAFGAEQRLNPGFHTTRVEVEVVDIASGERLSEWESGDIPQSISPNGDFIAVSSLQPQHGVLPLAVLDVHGHSLVELTGGFAFKEADTTKPLGRVMGSFVGNEHVLLTPDENVDHTGNHSGDSMQLVTITGKQAEVRQAIKPPHFAPQGELVVSANDQTVLVVSWHVPARLLSHEGALPASSPELLVFERNTDLKLKEALSIHGMGLKTSGWLENRRPRLSSDGSVIAIAQDGGVTVLTKSSSYNRHP